MQTELVELQKTDLQKSHEVLQTCITQLQEFESRTQALERQHSEKLIDLQRQLKQAQLDAQSQVSKNNEDVRKELGQRLSGLADQLEKKLEDATFQHKESQC